jgi:hypothetical protein
MTNDEIMIAIRGMLAHSTPDQVYDVWLQTTLHMSRRCGLSGDELRDNLEAGLMYVRDNT